MGGLLIFLSLSLVPLFVYATQKVLGWWPGNDPGDYANFYSWIKGGWFLIEVCTIFLTLVALYFIRFSLLTMLLYLALWFLSLDFLPFFLKSITFSSDPYAHDLLFQRITLIIFGLLAMGTAFILSRKKSTAIFSNWGYFFGVISFWAGITTHDYKTEVGHLVYLLLNISMILLAPFFKKKIFLLFGFIGVLTYLAGLVHRHFSTSAFFPFLLSAIGILVIAIGYYFQKRRQLQSH